ncbi:MAG: hypothetical protein A2539_01725 [Elusimicrobia bacterium RIFOXYD2_FULL_34_15]|nr:MAG: hypothetical protein A2539_01725 [Elusimicrobia bacterium RIFOXYD2_FULL_34_15]
MEKRTFLAIILSITILVLWQWFYGPKPSKPRVDSVPTITEKGPIIKGKEQIRKGFVTEKAIPVSKEFVETINIETSKMSYVLSEDEASIVHCYLKENALNEKTTVDLVLGGKLLNDYGSNGWAYVKTKDQQYQAKFVKTLDNFNIEKTFYFDNNAYLIDVEYILKNKTSSNKVFEGLMLSIGPGLGTDAKEMKENKGLLRAISYSEKKVEKLKVGNYLFPQKWVGIDNRYFLSVFFKTGDGFNNIKVEQEEKIPEMKIYTDKINFLPNEKKNLKIHAYVGPKGYTHLKLIKVDGTNVQLQKAVDFGFFGDLGELALSALNYLYKITGNYGWAIVIISVILNIVFFPLSKKSFQSANAMKAIQEDVKIIQAKYKSDPKKMNTEVWALYKSKGVNPFSGCLPMLVQLPIFWALFTMLRNAYELRGAHFMFWVTDLSAKDPYYVLPIIMGAGMFLQQKMTTSASDPTQKQMMILMPVIFTIMFLGFPSGLVIYWLTNNILTVLIQWLVLKKSK